MKAKHEAVNARPLAGRVALVTGGAKRIGKAIALELAKAGADVAITYRGSAAEARATVRQLRALKVRALAVQCDVSAERSVRAAVKSVLKDLGRLDVLVNNAGSYEAVHFEKMTARQWDAVFATNARGPFLMSRECAAELRKRHGRIVNIGSLGGIRPWPTHVHYCASKAALHMLTQGLAKALAPEIAVNCVAPGMIYQDEPHGSEERERIIRRTPMLRAGKAQDVASAVLFFAASAEFITGQILVVDGGLGIG